MELVHNSSKYNKIVYTLGISTLLLTFVLYANGGLTLFLIITILYILYVSLVVYDIKKKKNL